MTKSVDPEESLVKLFGSVSRARILNFLYAFEGQSFYQREIMYETGLVLRAVIPPSSSPLKKSAE
jgi:hypothetical protein